jgi:hypothetical protein
MDERDIFLLKTFLINRIKAIKCLNTAGQHGMVSAMLGEFERDINTVLVVSEPPPDNVIQLRPNCAPKDAG